MSQNFTLARKVGIELEGYVEEHPGEVFIAGAEIKQDGSLGNDCWSDHTESYGVEVCTEPMENLEMLELIWGDVQELDWSVDSSAGTHIHVDISDFSVEDKVRLLRFGKGIERIIYMFVQDYRNGNSYCERLHKSWRKVYRDERLKELDWSQAEGGNVNEFIYDRLRDVRRGYSDRGEVLWNGRYQWLNVFDSRYPTVEFRLYHAADDFEVLVQQAKMSEAIVNLVKSSSVAQLEFIIRELYKQTSVDAAVKMFFEVLGLDFVMKVQGERARQYMETKLAANVVSEAVEQGA